LNEENWNEKKFVPTWHCYSVIYTYVLVDNRWNIRL
jgi:hypothetical protein